MTGLLLIAAGLVVLAAEVWLTATGQPALGVPLMVITGLTLAMVAAEVRKDLRG